MGLASLILFRGRKKITNARTGEVILKPEQPTPEQIESLKIQKAIFTPMPPDVLAGGTTPTELSFTDLKRAHYIILSVKIRESERWMVRQKVRYVLKRDIEITSENTGNVLDYIPNDHKIEYDQAGQRIRLVGKHTSPRGYGEWKQVRGI